MAEPKKQIPLPVVDPFPGVPGLCRGVVLLLPEMDHAAVDVAQGILCLNVERQFIPLGYLVGFLIALQRPGTVGIGA